ncbi:MAG: hypothetical protein C4584_02665 [Armatimonadetes bacterium]|nr:MAG: hypothetical protein C4584_02665 [Armatimonadota bacterium]
MRHESSFRGRLAGVDFRFDVVQRQRRESERGVRRSLLNLTASKFVEAGEESLSLSHDLWSQGRFGLSKSELKSSIGAICLGNAVVHLERVLIGEPFCLREYVSDVEKGFDRVLWGVSLGNRFSDFPVERIPVDKLQEMWAAAKRDNTLAIFFQEDGLLPVSLEDLLRNTVLIAGGLMQNVGDVLPEYKRLASSVLNAPRV